MKEKIEKLLKEIEEREEYLNRQYDEAISDKSEDYYLGKWFEVNSIRRSLQEILKKYKDNSLKDLIIKEIIKYKRGE